MIGEGTILRQPIVKGLFLTLSMSLTCAAEIGNSASGVLEDAMEIIQLLEQFNVKAIGDNGESSDLISVSHLRITSTHKIYLVMHISAASTN